MAIERQHPHVLRHIDTILHHPNVDDGWFREVSAEHHDAGSAIMVPGCYARNFRAMKAEIGQLAIAEPGQLSDSALTVPERLDHADERKQHR
jgi:hypothetical protein